MSPPSDRVVVWLALLLVAFALVSLQQLARASAGHDFYQFWTVARFASDHPSADLYSTATARAAARAARAAVNEAASGRGSRADGQNRALYPAGIEPISTPFYYAVFAALTSADFDRDLMRFQLASLAAFALALFLGCRAFGYPRASAALALGVVGILFAPLHADVQTGNVNRLQLAWVALALALHWRVASGLGTACGAAILGLAVAFKPNLSLVPICLAIVWIVEGRRRELLTGAAGLAAAAVAVWVATPGVAGAWNVWAGWEAALSRYASNAAGIEQTNWGLARLLFERTGAELSGSLVAVFLVALAACAWRGRVPHLDRTREAIAVAAGLLAPLLVSPLAWDHYFTLALPACLLLLRPAAGGRVRAAVAVFALFVCGRGPLEAIQPLEPVTLAAWLAVATTALWITLLAELAGFRTGTRDRTPTADQASA